MLTSLRLAEVPRDRLTTVSSAGDEHFGTVSPFAVPGPPVGAACIHTAPAGGAVSSALASSALRWESDYQPAPAMMLPFKWAPEMPPSLGASP
jgi:hypothetical protein